MENLKKFVNGSYAYILLLVAVCTFFLSQNKNLGFDNYPHGYLSAHGMALSANLAKGDKIFMYNSASLSEGKITYDAYNRFPPASFMLISAVTSQSDTYDMRIYMARLLVGAFFCLSMIFAFLIALLFLKSKKLALFSALMVFGSYYFLHYSNMIFSDIFSLCFFTGCLYFVLLLNRGVRINKIGLFLFIVLAALTGWQSGAVLIFWCFIELIKKVLKKQNSFSLSFWCFFAFAFVAIGCFSLQLYFEYITVGGSFWDLSTVKSVLFRLGMAEGNAYSAYSERMTLSYFFSKEIFRIIRTFLPFYQEIYGSGLTASFKLFLAVYAVVVSLLFLLFLKFKNNVLKTDEICLLIFSGFFWTVPMRMHVAFHDFQTIFYVGIPLCFYILLADFLKTRKLLLVHFAFLLFIGNVFLAVINKTIQQKDTAVVSFEFDAIRQEIPNESTVYVENKEAFGKIGKNIGSYPLHVFDYYLAGCLYSDKDNADYVVALGKDYSAKRLTNNKYFNLFLK